MQIKLNGQFNYLFKHFELTFCIFLIKNMTVNLISFAIIVKFIYFVTKSVLNPVPQSVDDLRFP